VQVVQEGVVECLHAGRRVRQNHRQVERYRPDPGARHTSAFSAQS
jgi:hypothetical protein